MLLKKSLLTITRDLCSLRKAINLYNHNVMAQSENEFTKLSEADSRIEEAIQKLFNLDQVLKNICENIKEELGFDFVAISLINKEREIIESVQGTEKVQWINLAKHYLESEPGLRDIQADIYQTQCIEVISGNDPRFDDCIYKLCNHQNVIRVFIPIIVIESNSDLDRYVNDWFNSSLLVDIPWDQEKTEGEGQHQCYKFEVPSQYSNHSQIIGTVEAGYFDPTRQISKEKISQLAYFLVNPALQIWECHLAAVLKVIAIEARNMMNADSATLHYLYRTDQYNVDGNHFIYEVLVGSFLRQEFLRKCQPRANGLGLEAIRCKRPQFIANPEDLKERNPRAYKAGLRAMAAFPMNVGEESGVLYIGHTQIHEFQPTEIQKAEFILRRAGEAIRYARICRLAQYGEKQLTTLQVIAKSLLDTNQGTLLWQIAGNTRNILASDVVTIYEYIHSERRFLTPPDIAGKLLAPASTSGQGHRIGVPLWLVNQDENHYFSVLDGNEVFQNSQFRQQEKIRSVACVKLTVGTEVVGVMFINYRHHHDFTLAEKQFIETLASNAAIAIKNQQLHEKWLDTLNEIDRQIITTLDLNERESLTRERLFSLIVNRAVEITEATYGNILLLNPGLTQEELIIQYTFPNTSNTHQEKFSLDQGITGWVAKNRQSLLISNVTQDHRYIACQSGIQSELCVPLLDNNQKVLGVLNVESTREGAFNQKQQRSLEVLANQAVIGIQNIKNIESHSKTETIASLGELASCLVHRMNSDVGAIHKHATAISRVCVDPIIQSLAQNIIPLANRFLSTAETMGNWVLLSQPEDVNIDNIIVTEILPQICIPETVTPNICLNVNSHTVLGGKQQLIYVFENLINNAIEAMPDGGALSISSVRHSNTQMLVEILDEGEGISVENLSRIFDPDFSTKGSIGFGLWWTRFYIEKLGGQISIENSLNLRGTQVRVLLPLNVN